MKNKKIVSLMFFGMAIIISILIICSSKSYAVEVIPIDDQYMELKVVSTEPVDGAGTQAILELWSYNLDFKGVDVRFSYDSEKLTPSNLTTNIATTGIDCFAFENGFGGFLDMFQITESQSNVLRYVISLNPTMDEEGNVTYASTNSNLKTDATNGDYVSSTDGVLIGRLSFLLTEGAELDNTTFALVNSTTNSPLTGVKIAKTAEDYYSNQSVFRFTVTDPTGILEGSITTPATTTTTEKNNASIKVYNAADVIIDWTNVTAELDAGSSTDNVNETLKALTAVYEGTTNDDGTYSIELKVGNYVLLIDKPGHLDCIYIGINIEKNITKTLENQSLIPGDTDKNGVVNNQDAVKMYQLNGINSEQEEYTNACDFNDSDVIDNRDIVLVYQNNGTKRNILNCTEEE